MTEWIKRGVLGELQPIALKGYGKVVRLYFKRGLSFYLTSVREGNHMPGSFHSIGLAFDFKRQGMPLKDIKFVLDKDWDVVENSKLDMFHAEYDPK